jgi:leader peptidase (prepilin peptidase)/N-methyltransferase
VLPSLPVLGRCRHCRAPLARRYAATEIMTAALFGAAASQFRSWDVLIAVLVLFGFLVAISVVDIAAHRIPTRWVYETGTVLVILVVFTALRRDLPSAMGGAAIGAFSYFGFLLFFHLLSPRRMGFGDVRLAWVMGLVLGFLGWSSAYPVFGPFVLVVWGAFLGSLIGTATGLTVLVISRRNRYFPFGPGLAAGTIVVLLFITSFRPL